MPDDLILSDPEDLSSIEDRLAAAQKILQPAPHYKHHYYMAKAVELASKSQPDDSGPYVGAVLVKGGEIIAEAYKVRELWHGTRDNAVRTRQLLHLCHAEEKAIDIAEKHAIGSAKGATLYVTLEPCTTRNIRNRVRPSGTPCVELIEQAGIYRVVIGLLDMYNPEHAGSGVLALASAGIEVLQYTNGLADPLLNLIEQGMLRRESKKKEYRAQRIKCMAEAGKYIPIKRIKTAHDGKKRESNRLKKIIDAGIKEYEEDNKEEK